uniref:Conopeptide n=1 Tax=Conus lenavati TaxID=1519839 RepID=A0A0K8TU45_CONLV
MTTSSYFLLVALGLLLHVCQSSFGSQHTRGIKCGPELTEYLLTLCLGKRNDAGKKRGRASPLWKRRVFLSMLKAGAKRNEAFLLQRARPGIVEECCHKTCTDDEARKYCSSLM